MKVTKALALILGLAFIVSACGPSKCDCFSMEGKDDMSEEDMKALGEKCQSKYGEMTSEETTKAFEECNKKESAEEEEETEE